MIYAFDDFTLDTALAELRRGDEVVHLERQCFDLLCLLLGNKDRVLTKDEIFEQIWPDVFVTESTLSTRIKQVRRALGDDGQTQKYIKTLQRRGFRFVGEVSAGEPTPHPIVTAKTTASMTQDHFRAEAPTIAVIPFNLIGTDDTHQAIADALPTELISTLSRLRWIKVIARGSTFRFTATGFDCDDIRARLGASYVLSGSVELTGRRLSIMADLTDTRNHNVVWSDLYAGAIDDVFELRQRIARDVTTAVELRLPLNEADWLAKVPSENLDAWGHYHIGLRHLYRFNQADNTLAHRHLERAVALDPNFARAYASLSHTEFENHNLGFGPEKEQHHARAIAHAERAVDLDPFDPFCNLSLGRAKWIDHEVEQALGWVNRAIDLNPNYAFAHYNCGKLSAIKCDGTSAEHHATSALTLSPLDPHLQSMLSARALAAFLQDDGVRAVEFADQSLRAPNAHLFVCVVAAIIHTHYGQKVRAAEAVRQVGRLSSEFDRVDFLALFKLRDPAANRAFVGALDKLDL